ncbi:hypothetical protein C8J57DRAFT_1491104 [Mycena rebaudengoi]|nr:hypothetical protein C8J57DRAFT_1491104 [Mycena rebaudengoi]
MLSWFPQSPTTEAETEHNLNEQPPITLPHDRILGNFFGPSSENGFIHNASRSRTSSVVDPSNSLQDPFDGSFLGTLIAPDQNVQPEEQMSEVAAKNEELWSHLSRVLELQNQISSMHLDMENIRTNTNDAKGKSSRARAASASRVVSDDVEGEEGMEEKTDEETERNRVREQQFSKLSGQFQGRREAIKEIMTKLDSLSKAVTEFHALQAPKIDFPPSRQNSVPFTSVGPEAPAPSVITAAFEPATSSQSTRNISRPPFHFVDSPISMDMPLPP